MVSEFGTAYPLHWPPQKPRTPEAERRYGQFGYKNAQGIGGSYSRKEDITVYKATRRILNELGNFDRPGNRNRVDVEAIVISTNLELRKSDGRPRSDRRAPEDPGAVLYYELDGDPQVIAVDCYNKVEQNMAAIAAILECLRTMERHDSTVMKMAMAGIRGELPAPDQVSLPHWTTLFNVPVTADYDQVKKAFKSIRGKYHPDNQRSGNADLFDMCNKVWAQYDKQQQ